MTRTGITSQGVDALIEKLRNDGVAAGQAEADRILSEARSEATSIVEAAKTEAARHLRESRENADRYRAAGEEALNTAMRDAVLRMKSTMMAQFEEEVRHLVSVHLAEPEMIKAMVLALVGRARADANAGADAEVLLPETAITFDAIRENAEAVEGDALTRFTLGLTRDMLENGVTLHAEDGLHGGIRARLAEGSLLLNLSDEAVAGLLLQHLRPRFRAALEGVIS